MFRKRRKHYITSNLTTVTEGSLLKRYGKRVTYHKTAHAVAVIDTRLEIGAFPMSDLKVVFDDDDAASIIIECAHRIHYSDFQWHVMTRRVLREVEKYGEVNGYSVKATLGRNYVEVVYYKQEWWTWLNALAL